MNSRTLLFAALGLAILTGLLVLLRPPAPSSAPPQAAAQVAEYKVIDGQRVAGAATVTVRQGDRVTLRVISDRDDELHLHGYDLHLALHAGVPGELRFQAVHSGHFDFELHHADLELGSLDVLPR